jgi:hypothetical protein
MEQEKGGTQYKRAYDARRSESKAPPVAQFVNAAHDIQPCNGKKLCM